METINEIISKCRKITVGEAEKLRKITPKECRMFYVEIEGGSIIN